METKFTDMIGRDVNVGDIIVIPHSCDGLSQNLAMVTELKFLTKTGQPRKEPELVWRRAGGRKWNRDAEEYEFDFLNSLGWESKSKHSTVKGYSVNITKLLTPEENDKRLLLQIT